MSSNKCQIDHVVVDDIIWSSLNICQKITLSVKIPSILISRTLHDSEFEYTVFHHDHLSWIILRFRSDVF